MPNHSSTRSASSRSTRRPSCWPSARGLVVLDNCEHVLAAAREVATELSSAASSVVVLATSREPLGIAGEQVVVVEPLGLPAPGGADAELSPSVTLFLERAAAAGAALEPDAGVARRRRRAVPAPRRSAAGDRARRRPHAGDRSRRAAGGRRPAPRPAPTHPRRGDRHDSMRAAIEVSTSLLDGGRAAVLPSARACSPARSTSASPTPSPATVSPIGWPRSTCSPDSSSARWSTAEIARLGHPLPPARAAPRARRSTSWPAPAELDAVEERFVEAMVAAADAIVAARPRQLGPGPCSARPAASTPTSCGRCELCLRARRRRRRGLPAAAADVRRRPRGPPQRGVAARRTGARPLARCRRAVAGRGAGRAGDGGGHRRTQRRRRPAGGAARRRRPGGQRRRAGARRPGVGPGRPRRRPVARRRALRARPRRRRPGRASRRWRSRSRPSAPASSTSPATPTRRSTCWPTCCVAADDADDVFVVVLAHLVRCRVPPAGRRRRRGRQPSWPRRGRRRRRWGSRGGRRRCCARRPRSPRSAPAAGRRSTPLWRRPSTSPPAAAPSARSPSRCARRRPSPTTSVSTSRPPSSVRRRAPLDGDHRAARAVPRRDGRARGGGAGPRRAGHAPRRRAATGPRRARASAAARRPRPRPSSRRPPPARRARARGRLLAGRVRRAHGARPRHEGDRRPRRPVARPGRRGARARADGRSGRRRGRRPGARRAGPPDVPGRASSSCSATSTRPGATTTTVGPSGPSSSSTRSSSSSARRSASAAAPGPRAPAPSGPGRPSPTGCAPRSARSAELHPELGRHLANAVRTGTWCSYQPETDVTWTIERRGLTV